MADGFVFIGSVTFVVLSYFLVTGHYGQTHAAVAIGAACVWVIAALLNMYDCLVRSERRAQEIPEIASKAATTSGTASENEYEDSTFSENSSDHQHLIEV